MEHGDDVFIPSFIWPQNPRRQIAYPATHRFGTALQYVQLQLTKQSNKQFSKPCNDTKGYVYGGKFNILISRFADYSIDRKNSFGDKVLNVISFLPQIA